MGDQESKEFSLGDILSVIYGRLLSPNISNVHEIKDFITGNTPKLTHECKDYLSKQFPQLASPEMDFEVAKLAMMLESPVTGNDSDMLVIGWLSKQTTKYGETFAVRPISQTNKEFHLGDILSVIYNRLLSPSLNIDNVYEIQDFITGNTPKLTHECKDYLSKQFPQLASPEMDFEVAKLAMMLESPVTGNDSDMLVIGWLSKQTTKYGETFAVRPISQTN